MSFYIIVVERWGCLRESIETENSQETPLEYHQVDIYSTFRLLFPLAVSRLHVKYASSTHFGETG
jgi:hypothetical protein